MQSTKKIIEDFMKGKMSVVELSDFCGRRLEDNGHIYTNNFGWVKKEDYDKFSFLRRDKGVPVVESRILELEKKNVNDPFGNEKEKKVPVRKKRLLFDDEWIQYQKLLKAREMEKEAMDDLVKKSEGIDETSPTKLFGY